MSRWNCPVELPADSERVSLSIGEGARHTRRFLQKTVFPRLRCSSSITDATLIEVEQRRLAICTDSHTVTPLFFPGGDLGSLSVIGTVNDLAVSGAMPRWLTMSLILEEGLPMTVLERLLDSAAAAAQQCDITIVAGDTKVVPRGAVDGIFINTTGVGEFGDSIPAGPKSLEPGDRILVSGPIGQHGLAVLSSRQGMAFLNAVESDLKCLLPGVSEVLKHGVASVKCLRDATRGGVSAVLHEWAEEANVSFELDQSSIPVSRQVRGACEILGLEPLHLANEGTFLAAVAPSCAEGIVNALRSLPQFPEAELIGTVIQKSMTPVAVRRLFGSPIPLDEPAGAPFPRIC